jgi:hypothetical protein
MNPRARLAIVPPAPEEEFTPSETESGIVPAPADEYSRIVLGRPTIPAPPLSLLAPRPASFEEFQAERTDTIPAPAWFDEE